MKTCLWPFCLPVVAIVLFSSPSLAGGDATVSFERDVRPLLKAYCFRCHGEAGVTEGGLDLRLCASALRGGDSGPAIHPNAADDSLLIARLENGEMPPADARKRPTREQIHLIRRWVELGANTEHSEPESLGPHDAYFTPEERAHWSFQPISRPSPPAPIDPRRAEGSIDAFLQVRLAAESLEMAPEADRHTLIRRASFDLLGLPPSPEEVDQFVNDPSPDAYVGLIDRLLVSPHYGERWARHWLDVAGYADSNGVSGADSERPYAYKYRDYLIRSLNADRPFDEMLIEQLAGDELVSPPYEELSPEQLDKLIATGFLRLAPDGTGDEAPDLPLARNQVVADTLQIVGTSLLGMSVHCAQCHDHRHDPIPQNDYYRLRAIFEPALNWLAWRTPRERLVSLQGKDDRERSAAIEAEAVKLDAARDRMHKEALEKVFERELAKLPEILRDAARVARNTPRDMRTPEQTQLLKENPAVDVQGALDLYDPEADKAVKQEGERAAALRATKPVEEFAHVLTEPIAEPPPTLLFYRGDHEQPRHRLMPSTLSVVHGVTISEKDSTLPTTGRRLAFARWIVGPNNPLTARVFANRIWRHHFGGGIVTTLGDFGLLGDRPSHPELLDYLASQLVANGWRLKSLHREIMLSYAYRQSHRNAPATARDPDNRLVGRQRPTRLDAESFRDALLAVSGTLNRELFGPPLTVGPDSHGQIVVGKATKNVNGERWIAGPIDGDGGFRRSIYVQVRRTEPVTLLETFDSPTMRPNCESRSSSTVATQSLLMLNDEFVVDQSRRLVARAEREVGGDQIAQLERLWRLAFAAPPTDGERVAAADYLAAQTARLAALGVENAGQSAMASLAQALLASNRFLYVD